jgi:hypothetical protein
MDGRMDAAHRVASEAAARGENVVVPAPLPDGVRPLVEVRVTSCETY